MKTYSLNDSLGYLIGQVRRSLVNCLNHEIDKSGYNVTPEQGLVLMNLWEKDGQSQNELAGISCKDKTSITRLIHGMEKRGLIVRKSNVNDHRQKLVCLTDHGKKMQRKFMKVLRKISEKVEGNIEVEDLKVCKSVLKKVINNASIH